MRLAESLTGRTAARRQIWLPRCVAGASRQDRYLAFEPLLREPPVWTALLSVHATSLLLIPHQHWSYGSPPD